MADMQWKISSELVDYAQAVAEMEVRVADIRAGTADEMVWCLEHPPLYTAGSSAKTGDLLQAQFPVHETGRGGQYTYHGPGQRIAYVMLDLKQRMQEPDLRLYVQLLEKWLINTLGAFGVEAFTRDGRIGVWVDTPQGEKKIAALGIRVRHWVSYHGIALNVNPNLSHYEGIIPCGIREFGVTSLWDMGIEASMEAVDKQLRHEFERLFR